VATAGDPTEATAAEVTSHMKMSARWLADSASGTSRHRLARPRPPHAPVAVAQREDAEAGPPVAGTHVAAHEAGPPGTHVAAQAAPPVDATPEDAPLVDAPEDAPLADAPDTPEDAPEGPLVAEPDILVDAPPVEGPLDARHTDVPVPAPACNHASKSTINFFRASGSNFLVLRNLSHILYLFCHCRLNP